MDLLIHHKELDTADKVQLIISYILQLIIIGSAAYLCYKEQWLNALLVIGILLLTLIPSMVRKGYKVMLPVEFDLLTVGFIFLALYLGEVHAYYTKYWWWDIVLHTSSGFLLGIAGFVLIYVLNEEKKINVMLNIKFLCLFAFAFAVAMGAIWEIIEFTLDQTINTTMQHNSLYDTMWDLIVDTAGALVISILGYFYISSRGFLIFDRMLHRMVDNNPHLFKKRKFVDKVKNASANIKFKLKRKLHQSKEKLKHSKNRILRRAKRKNRN